MMDRVDAVANALAKLGYGHRFDWQAQAKVAIQANDDWLLPDWVSDDVRQAYLATVDHITQLRAKIDASKPAED